MKNLTVRVTRRRAKTDEQYTETFFIPREAGMSVITVLERIRENPINSDGEATSPVVWECNCLEEVCGACAMLINGKPRMACSAILDDFIEGDELVLEPLSKFPVVCDLMVDRTAMRDALIDMKAYIEEDHMQTHSPKNVAHLYPFTRCISCGICIEACPNTATKTCFDGAFAYGKLRLKLDGMKDKSRLAPSMDAIKKRGGIATCSGHSLCAKHCPKSIDLPGAFGYLNRKILFMPFLKKKKSTVEK